MKKAHIMVGRLLEAKARGLPIPLPNSWKPRSMLRSRSSFRKWFIKLISGINPMWMGHEACPFCDARLYAGGYMLEPIQFRDKRIQIMIWHGYYHFVFDHCVRPAFGFFKALRNKDYANLIYADECIRTNKGIYIVI